MKLISLLIGASLLLAPGASNAEDLVYGSCKKWPDRKSEFYRCLSVDRQIVYTNVLPTKEAEKKFQKEYRKREQERVKLAQKQPEVPTIHMPSIDDIKDEPKLEEQKPVDTCITERSAADDLIHQWGDLALQWKGRGDGIDKQMDQIELALGHHIEGPCGKP